MPLEVKNVAKQDFHAPSPERKWINNLGVAFQRVQYVINAAAMRAVPDFVLQPPPSIVVVPDTEFDSLVITGVNNATPQDARLATRKKKELVQGNKTTVVGMYLNNDATILLPERTAKEFQRGGAAGLRVTLALAEEYLHHVSTQLSPDGSIDRMGFYHLDDKKLERTLEPGEVYVANLDNAKGYGMPEAAGNKDVMLTEHATKLLVYCLAKEFGGGLLGNHNALGFALDDGIKIIDFVGIKLNPLITRQLFRALISGNPSLINFTVDSATQGHTTVNILEWLSNTDFGTLLIDLQRTTGDQTIDYFSYQERPVRPRLPGPEKPQSKGKKGRR